MTQKNDGGPAFPQSDTLYEDGCELVRASHGGMTLRDWFAGQALPALIALVSDEQEAAKLSQAAYLVADAMIAARGQA